MYSVEYARGVIKDLKGLSADAKRRALEVVEKVLARDPGVGSPLKGAFEGLWRYRFGDYRVIYKVERKRLVVFVLRIRHRKDVYKGIV